MNSDGIGLIGSAVCFIIAVVRGVVWYRRTRDVELDELTTLEHKLDEVIAAHEVAKTGYLKATTTMPEYEFKTIVMPLGTNGDAEMHYQVRVPPSQKAREAAGIFAGAVSGSIEDRPVLEEEMRHTLCAKCGTLKLLTHVQFPAGVCETCLGSQPKPDLVYAKQAAAPPKATVLDVTSFSSPYSQYEILYGVSTKKKTGPGSVVYLGANEPWASVTHVKPKQRPKKPAPPPEPVFERLDRSKRKIDLDD